MKNYVKIKWEDNAGNTRHVKFPDIAAAAKAWKTMDVYRKQNGRLVTSDGFDLGGYSNFKALMK